MRHGASPSPATRNTRFNLRREAAPHATFLLLRKQTPDSPFQSQTRSRSTCDVKASRLRVAGTWFQSQTRSRSTCDASGFKRKVVHLGVSISDEKPLHMRQHSTSCKEVCSWCFNLRREAAPHATSRGAAHHAVMRGFNLRREAAPHATLTSTCVAAPATCFNLRREAAPHATLLNKMREDRRKRFQSQTRSRSTCDSNSTPLYTSIYAFQAP